MKKTLSVDAQQPEVLATFAAATRGDGTKPDTIGLLATPETRPLNTNLNAKHAAATKVLQEGTTHTDRGADKAVRSLPDRTKLGKSGGRATR